ncbi:MAG: acetyltransferase [Deltaproteobacteria bacterium CG_4_9_14_3_um_filter_65_9]|nr:MAG: acetyltransferase [Deltaproteobacteria bacterium CG_4_9_14_3_um_filter_65_9]
MESKRTSIRQILSDTSKSPFRKYRDLTVGEKGIGGFLVYETSSALLGPVPGALGIFFRQKIYPNFFRRCGRGLIVGRNCTFRHPSKMSFGDNVTIDDNTLIDARGASGKGVVFGDGVIINRNSIVQSKEGDIEIDKSVSIGSNSTIVSWSGIRIGDGALIAGGCSLSAGRFDFDDLNRSIAEQDSYSTGPIVIDENVWLASRVTVLDGVHIGKGAIISAGSVVTVNIPPGSVAHGNPAKVVFTRR